MQLSSLEEVLACLGSSANSRVFSIAKNEIILDQKQVDNRMKSHCSILSLQNAGID